jgi:site-specific recombinase XerC
MYTCSLNALSIYPQEGQHESASNLRYVPASTHHVRTVQLLLGHESLETTMIYTYIARKGVTGVTSPLDLLGG